MSNETVGSLLAIIANSLNDGLRIMMFADKREWGPDEFEQLHLLEETLDEAKKDFQELPALVNGRFYYENDRKTETLEDLRILCTRFELHSRTFKDWARGGGPIDATWARETMILRRDLHRAQCRAVRRIYNDVEQADPTYRRCLGALQVYRVQRSPENPQQRGLEELVACNSTGKFERFGERDISFVCDFCDGYLVWEDLRDMPNSRLPAGVALEPVSATGTTTAENWQARGFAWSTGEEKAVVYAPVVIANHLPPEPGEWQARVLCPYCDEDYYEEQGEEDMERVKYAQDESGLEHVKAFKEHLEWYHTSMVPSTSSCSVM